MTILQELKNFDNLKPGDVITVIKPGGSYEVLEFLARDPKLKEGTDIWKKYGYFLDSWGREKVIRLYSDNLGKQGNRYFLGFDGEFVLEEEVKLQQELLTHLQDQLTKKREYKAKNA